MATVETNTQEPGATRPTKPRQPGVGVGAKAVGFINGGFLIFWGLITTLPLIWAILSAFKRESEFLNNPAGLPSGLQWDNFSRAWVNADIGKYFVNSVIVVSMSLTLTMLLSAMAAYVLARYDFPGNRFVYFGFVLGLIFPVFLALVPLFFIVRNTENIPLIGQFLGLNSFFSLAIVYAAFSLPFTVFFLTAFFRTLPHTVAEAAIMDGCSHFTLFWRVMLPMAKPGLISLALFNFLGHWNQYILPVTLMGDRDHRVLAQGIAQLAINMGYRGDWTALFAGLVIAMLPILIVYILFQKKVQAGLTAGLLK
jgi:N-acetylglucosamine transport system permease protein